MKKNSQVKELVHGRPPYRDGEISDRVHKEIAESLQAGLAKLIGDLYTVIESLGLPEKQEKAVKDVISSKYYERYINTTDKLLGIVFRLDDNLNPGTARSLSCFDISNLKRITGCEDIG